MPSNMFDTLAMNLFSTHPTFRFYTKCASKQSPILNDRILIIVNVQRYIKATYSASKTDTQT
jgi:hypothetical protein